MFKKHKKYPNLQKAHPGLKDNIVQRAKSLQSCLTLCNPMDCSLPGSSIHGILPDPGFEPTSLTSPALAGGFFITSAIWEAKIQSRKHF